jgi:hypothetical protein
MSIAKVTLYAGFAGLLIAGSWVAGLTARSSPATAQEAAATKKQKNRLARFKRYGTGQDLRERAVKESGDIVVMETAGIMFDMPGRPPFINLIACDAEAIVIGKIKSKSSSQFTEDGGFIFTGYELTVEEVIKDDAVAPLQPDGTLTISQPGGEVQFKGKTVRAIDESFKPFEENRRYVLFLRRTPSAGRYDAFGNGSFQLNDDSVAPQGEGTVWGRVESRKSVFLEQVKQVAASPCPFEPEALM